MTRKVLKNKLVISGIFTVVIALIIISALLLGIITPIFTFSLLYAALIGAGNFILFSIFAYLSFKKSNKYFLIMNLGGMLIRLILMLIVVFLMLNYLKVDRYAFIFGLLFWYLFYQIFEILIVKESYKNS